MTISQSRADGVQVRRFSSNEPKRVPMPAPSRTLSDETFATSAGGRTTPFSSPILPARAARTANPLIQAQLAALADFPDNVSEARVRILAAHFNLEGLARPARVGRVETARDHFAPAFGRDGLGRIQRLFSSPENGPPHTRQR